MARTAGREAADAQLLVLISLAPEPKHGHAIMLDIAAFSGHRLGPGTLYGAIERLESAGLIAPEPRVGRRLPYRLTEAGRAFLARRLATIEALSRVGMQRVAR
jgi:DNA-binding PadR family transcriptional regulator